MAKVDSDKLKAKYEKVRAEYQKHQKSERKKLRALKAKEDLERKIVIGEFVLYLLEIGEYNRERFMTRLERYLEDNRRRSLFGFEERDGTTETTGQGASLPLVEQGSGGS